MESECAPLPESYPSAIKESILRIAIKPNDDDLDQGLNSSTRLTDLAERVRLLEAVIQNFPGGLMLFDNEFRLIFCNNNQRRMLDYPDSLFKDRVPTLEEITRFNAKRGEYGDGDIETLVQERMERSRARRPHVFERVRPNGTVLQIRGVPIDGGGFVTTYLDITDQYRERQDISYRANHDELTGLANRAAFNVRLQKMAEQSRHGDPFAILYLDLNGFKPVNDKFGHAVGDHLLIKVADRLRQVIRAKDMAARIGGDEFAIILSEIQSDRDATHVAHRVVASIERPFCIEGRTLAVGASVGISLAPIHGVDAQDLLKKADQAMYTAKQSPSANIVTFKPTANRDSREHKMANLATTAS